ncbi:hypothetical protein ASD8599_01739 [Ascidiaceihabitans donghaensis]|uniref:Mu-like prophage FluMu protein gp29 n=1 Tax=Ascidiaceihabitans donghaensis TaxID=1510460 RepID=A0A2R8BD38_9RHOB|nr:DUF935 domain-containing protein [Ascidiaceihabitans donghaensis]SPH20998.1 hypothetical protein ASD8599_01739 [Ascidiaceihabitans donghaensis]
MPNSPALLDRFGNPVRRADLNRPIEPARFGSPQNPVPSYPGDGLEPVRLASIMRAADIGEPMQFLSLAEQIEERDPHYLGVLSTRKRSVSQIDITVEEASDDPQDVARAELVRDWVNRLELSGELFLILDCIGKGFSITEIGWEKSEGQWWPGRLEQLDPRAFRFAKHNLKVPVELDATGAEKPLEPFRYIHGDIQAKSGLPLRSGLARVAAWGWMFKAYTQRDWALFAQTFGQPVRLGRYGPNASDADRRTLWQAVSGIAGDCAAIIPEGMKIEFISSPNVGASSNLYEARADWLDKQISKAVLGQTATTDAVTGGLGSGKEHREVQEDIETADAKALSAILNRDLIRPWMTLEFGPLKRYPLLKIERPKPEDLKTLSEAVALLGPLGLRVSAKQMRDKLGLQEPVEGEEVLAFSAANSPETLPQAQNTSPAGRQTRSESKFKYLLNTLEANSGTHGGQTALQASDGPEIEGVIIDALNARFGEDGQSGVEDIMEQVEAMMSAANDLSEFRDMLISGFGQTDGTQLATVMQDALAASYAAGRVSEIEDANG